MGEFKILPHDGALGRGRGSKLIQLFASTRPIRGYNAFKARKAGRPQRVLLMTAVWWPDALAGERARPALDAG